MEAGRPLKYKTVEELEKKIDQFFEERHESGIPPTVAGLALWLGFASRFSLYDYKERPEYSHTIKKAIERIEDYAERIILTNGASATGAIFWLKNHRWTDRTVQDVNVNGYSLFEKETEEKAKRYADKHTNRNIKGNGK